MKRDGAEFVFTGCCFVAPALDGPISGGTLYNRELCAALAGRGHQVVACALDDPRLAASLATAHHVLVDSLYLGALPGLTVAAGRSLYLLTHYLPALVRAGRAVSISELDATEAQALSST